MNIQSSKSHRQVYSWAGKSAAQVQKNNQVNPTYSEVGGENPFEMHFRRLFQHAIGFLVLLILAPFIMLGLAIAIAALF
mgnify:CR=1 FL=1